MAMAIGILFKYLRFCGKTNTKKIFNNNNNKNRHFIIKITILALGLE